MSDDKRLKDKLARLADDGDGRASPGDDPLRAIVLEIDETILPRRLTFRAADGAELALEAANRRLLSFLDLPADVAGEAERATLLAPLPPDDGAALAAAADALGLFVRRHGPAQVTTGPLDRDLDPSGIGRSASAIAEALGLDLYTPPVPVILPDPARGFEAGLAEFALATAILGKDAAPAAGPDAVAVRRLSETGADALDGLLAHLGPVEARAGRFLLLAGGTEALFLGQADAGRAVAALVPATHAGVVVALWQATRDA